jgi:lipoyl-dependent peroxiredoxin subunit D
MNQTETTFTFDSAVEANEGTIAKDLRLNLRRLVEEGSLNQEEANLALLATACSVQYDALSDFAKSRLEDTGFSPEQIQEAAESSAIMAMLNTYYRFKHMVGKDEEYRAAGLRMTSLGRPVLGKEKFEMLSFAISVLNGCESCIRSHEAVLRNVGVSVDKIHDLARLAAVVKALKVLSSCQKNLSLQ